MNMKPKYKGGNHILTQFLTLQTSNFTMTQNVLNIVHSISANHLGPDTISNSKVLNSFSID